MDFPTLLIILNIAGAIPCVVFNIVALGRWRRELNAGQIAIFSGLAILALYTAWAYTQVLQTPSMNVVLLRITVLFWEGIGTAVPVQFGVRRRGQQEGADMHQVVVEKKRCQEELARVTLRLINVEQALEMRETTNKQILELLDIKTKELLDLQNEQ